MLKRKSGSNSPDEELLEIIQTESTRLSAILNNLLGYVKPYPLRMEETDLSALVNEVTTLFSKDPGGQKDVKVTASIPESALTARLDGSKVRQALWNLLTNAIKAVRKEGQIHVNLKKTDDSVVIEVEDNGIGMAPSEIENFIQPFRHGFEQGTGLGLPMVYQTMELHGGRLEIKSKLGKGTTTRMIFLRRESNG